MLDKLATVEGGKPLPYFFDIASIVQQVVDRVQDHLFGVLS